MATTAGMLTDPTEARRYILSGDVMVTLRSVKTGTQFTYRVHRAKEGATETWFVTVLASGLRFLYLGVITEHARLLKFKTTHKSVFDTASPQAKAFDWTWTALEVRQEMPDGVEITTP